MPSAKWKEEPDDHDYPAAADYLALIAPPEVVTELVAALKAAPIVHKKAKDILRSATLPLLGTDDAHVHADLQKVNDGKHLSPVLLVRGDHTKGIPLQIADGYHRVCASYHLDVNTDIPAKLI